jgi:chromosomal replication initiation ATPase DnaA
MQGKTIKIANYTRKRNDMGKQYTLPLNYFKSEYSPYDFIFSSCNSTLKIIIDSLPESSGVQPYPNIMLLTGGKKSGKTHFANVFQHKSSASLVMHYESIENLHGKYFIIDDIDKVFTEEKLFHLFNYFCENNKIALFICENYNGFKLKDLTSRLGSVREFNIAAPDDVMIKTLLSKHLLARSLHVSEDVIKYLITRIPRSFESIFKFVDFIDRLSLEQKRNINIHFLSSLPQDVFMT